MGWDVEILGQQGDLAWLVTDMSKQFEMTGAKESDIGIGAQRRSVL